MPAPQIIEELVERFRFNITDYKKGNYNETQVRREFIDPFFHALGWDVSNEKGYAEAYKDVIHEFSLKTKDKAEAPDYLFRIGGTKKFFVEAKKPSVNLHDDISPAFQLRRYAWSAKLPLSILTDFEELVIYDCRIQPKKNDKSSTGRINYFTYDQYIEKWDEIESIFSREAILKGSFDKFAESNKGKRGTAEVDDAFLKEIEKWRELLARNIALRNESLTNRELNFAVQKTIDRIIFLRICEDRGIEDYGQLMNLQNGANVYQRMLQIFTRADEKYNSGLFHFEDEKSRNEDPDKITPTLAIDDDKLKEIIKNLYYPDSPYEFSVLPSDILGHVYEQFLGKVIRLTKGHQAKIEEKPEVKKAGGVYYTPTYIVDYIVKNTLGKKLEEIEEKYLPVLSHSDPDLSGEESHPKSSVDASNIKKAIKEASKIKVLDPACGSGSFLIGAYQYLLDWHIKLYSVEISFMKSPTEQTVKAETSSTRLADGQVKSLQNNLYQTKEGEYRLTTGEKKRILLNNIYGVDIDSQAVEVTKLSLLLKVLEGETDESLNTQLSMFRERALPDLSDNIKCGNSLIGPDFYNQTELELDEDEQYRINVFDWKDEFKEIMNNGGFDCVIGNPPYVFGRDWNSLNITSDEKRYFHNRYNISPYQLDMFSLFMEKVNRLTMSGGFVGQIVPNVWLSNTYSSVTRKFILANTQNLNLIFTTSKVFPKLTVDTIIYTYKLHKHSPTVIDVIQLEQERAMKVFSLEADEYANGEKPISLKIGGKVNSVLNKLLDSEIKLNNICKITRGIHPYRKGGYGKSAFGNGYQVQKDIDERPYHSQVHKSGYRPFVYGKDLKRFSKIKIREYVKYGDWLAEPRNSDFFNGERIYSRKILGKYLIVTYVDDDSVADQQVYITKPFEQRKNLVAALTAVLGSKLISFFIRYYYDEVDDAFPQIKVSQLKNIPIPKTFIELKNNSLTIAKELIDKSILLNEQKNSVKTPQEKKNIERQIAAVDKQIDELVYELYGLTEDEIKIVEESIK